ncbi:MAG: DUF4440 domain-containing protein [Gammaproteobacteria bacterium]
MRPLFALTIVALTLALPQPAPADTKDDVMAATQAWVDALNSHDPARVVALYDTEAVFWGTVSPTLRDNPAAILDYFKNLPNRPQLKVEVGEHRLRVYGEIALNTGYYTFSDVREGKPLTIPARFSFTYRLHDGHWMIIDHHSSAVPTPPQ